MSGEQKVTEREAVMREFDAFVGGIGWACDWLYANGHAVAARDMDTKVAWDKVFSGRYPLLTEEVEG